MGQVYILPKLDSLYLELFHQYRCHKKQITKIDYREISSKEKVKQMKIRNRIISIMLSLFFVLSIFTSCAKAATAYPIPKTIKTVSESGQKGTISFSVKGNTLAANGNVPDEDVSGPVEYWELAFLPSTANLNQQLISILSRESDYCVLPSAIIFSPLLTSGKINKVVDHSTERGTDSYTVKAKNGHVTQYGDERYTYDSKGNLIAQTDQEGSVHFKYNTANQLVAIQVDDSLLDSSRTFKWSSSKITSSDDEVIQISNGKIMNVDDINLTWNPDGTLGSYNYPCIANHSVIYQTINL